MLESEPQRAAALGSLATPPEGRSSLWRDAWHRLLRNRLAVFGAGALASLALLCLAAPLLTPDPNAQDLSLYAAAPSRRHPMGTDLLGRDLFARVLHGGRLSLAVGVVATAVALGIGVTYGSVAGYLGGGVDALMMRVVDVLYALPFTVVVILLTVFFGRSLGLLFVAIGAVEWLTMARIVRGQVRAVRRLEFIESAKALGLTRQHILWRHIVPNVLGPVIVYTTLTIPAVILLEAFLSFLGLGVQPPGASWGTLIGEGAKGMEEFPWLLAFPGGALVLTLFSFNFLGDGLRDALDPKSAKD